MFPLLRIQLFMLSIHGRRLSSFLDRSLDPPDRPLWLVPSDLDSTSTNRPSTSRGCSSQCRRKTCLCPELARRTGYSIGFPSTLNTLSMSNCVR